MMRPRRASVIAALSLLAWTATASAECAWVLWAGTEKNPRPVIEDPIQWTPMESYGTKGECLETLSRTAKSPKNKGWEFRCLSDAVDPRWLKGK